MRAMTADAGGPPEKGRTDRSGGSKKKPKAGRDLAAAITVGVCLGAMIVAVLALAPKLWVAVIAVAMVIATIEVAKRFNEHGVATLYAPAIIGGQSIIWASFFKGAHGMLAAYAATVVVCMIWCLLRKGLGGKPDQYLAEVTHTLFVVTWVPFFASFSVLLVQSGVDGWKQLVCLFVVVVCSDVGGYATGVFFGRHPMAPAISPAKSWEGFAGAVLLSQAGSILVVRLLLGQPYWVGVALGALMVLTATGGDLVESQVKRDLGIKDMGTLLPGHGGIMDRLDSLLPSAAAAWIVLDVLS
jgi:phosphatidate cytidylyltransferase